MIEKQEVKENEEIDFIYLVIVILKHRFLILITIVLTCVLLIMGYFFIPEQSFNRKNDSNYVKAQMSLSMHPFIAQFMKSDKEILYSNDQNDLVVINSLKDLFLNKKFLVKSIVDSGNTELLLNEESNANYISIVGNHIIDLNRNKPKSLSISEVDWIYQVDRKSYSIEITTYFRRLDKRQADNFLLVTQENANSSILKHIKPIALKRISDYQDYFGIDAIDSVPYDILFDYIISLGIVRSDLQPLVIVDGPNVKSYQNTLDEYKKEYIKKSIIIFIAILFFIIFFIYVKEFFHALKNNKELYDKIKNALGKK